MKTKCFFMLVVLVLVVKTAAGQGCEQILFGGVFNTFNQQGVSQSNEQWHNAWCNGTVIASSGSSASGAALDIGIAKISLGFSFSDAQEFQRVYKQSFCSTESGSSFNYASNVSVQKVASPDILKAYTDCKAIEAKGLKVDFSLRDDHKVFVISAIYGGAIGTAKVKKIAFLPNVVQGTTGSLVEGLDMEKNKSYALTAERTLDVPMTVVIDTDVGTFSRNISPFIPPPSDQERLMAAMPRGTILGWYGQTVPKGWVICDGTNGTPKLDQRFPMGTSKLAEIGAEGGSQKGTGASNTGAPINGLNGNVQQGGSGIVAAGNDHQHSFSVTVDTIPPFAKIGFIMKL